LIIPQVEQGCNLALVTINPSNAGSASQGAYHERWGRLEPTNTVWYNDDSHFRSAYANRREV